MMAKTNCVWLFSWHMVCFAALPAIHAESQAPPGVSSVQRIAEARLTGDLDDIRKRRILRVLVNYSRTDFFIDKGVARGFECELLREYEKFLNRGVTKEDQKTQVVFIPLPFGKLLDALRDGSGDMVAAGMTVTRRRQGLVAFTDPYLPDVDEVIVAAPHVKGLKSLADLSGRRVYVHGLTSFAQHLADFNRTLSRDGRPPVQIVDADEDIDPEGILELMNAGIVDLTVSDEHVAQLWARVLTNIIVRTDLKVNAGGQIAWATRKENPKLLTSLNEFVRTVRKGSLLGNIFIKRYYANTKWIRNPVASDEIRKLDRYAGHFRFFGHKYGFDWLQLSAQAYQESRLDQSARSRAGAIGLMQVLPSTARAREVGIPDISSARNNIHAGARYMHHVRETYFKDPALSDAVRWDFTLAAYNAGPTRISRLRKEAASRGLDPNRWFYNVEYLALETIGREPVRYVGNINKYYAAYRLSHDLMQKRRKAVEARIGQVE